MQGFALAEVWNLPNSDSEKVPEILLRRIDCVVETSHILTRLVLLPRNGTKIVYEHRAILQDRLSMVSAQDS